MKKVRGSNNAFSMATRTVSSTSNSCQEIKKAKNLLQKSDCKAAAFTALFHLAMILRPDVPPSNEGWHLTCGQE